MPDPVVQADPHAFAAFRQRVFADANLQRRLRRVTDRTAFLDLVVTLGAEAGYRFDVSDVVAVMQEGQFAWLTHWFPVL